MPAWRRMLMQHGYAWIVAAVVAAGVAGCDEISAQDTPAPASADEVEMAQHLIRCNAASFEVPADWTMNQLQGNRWSASPPGVSEGPSAAWIFGCLGDVVHPDWESVVEESARLVSWSPAKPVSRVQHMLGDERLYRMPPFSIGCRQDDVEGDTFEVCVWDDPYPRRTERANGFLSFRWRTDSPADVRDRKQLVDRIEQTFYIQPLTDSPAP